MTVHTRAAAAGIVSLVMAGLAIAPTADSQTGARPVPSISVPQLERLRGPQPPQGATYLGIEKQPSVGGTQLPIQNVKVYQFSARTQAGKTIPVKWAYVPGQGTYMWATAPIQCADGNTIPNGSYAIKVRDDGSGGFLLGTNQCAVGEVFGCQFDSFGSETACGACAWDNADLACESTGPGQ
jgi:hypothetical protein